MPKGFSAKISNRVEELTAVLAQLEAFAGKQRLPQDTVFKLRLVAEEVLTNQVKYAYPPGSKGWLSMDIALSGNSLRLEFCDGGTPFNPLTAQPPRLELPPQQRSEGGLGIHLVKSLSAAMEYKHLDGKNILFVTLEGK